MKIVAIDFETANHHDGSMCAVGLAIFDRGQLVDSFYSLIRPPQGTGRFRADFVRNHGITRKTVRKAPEFPVLAPQIFQHLAAADIVITHNAAFNMRILRGTVAHFNMQCPPFCYLCTHHLSWKLWPKLKDHNLPTVAAHIGHKFEHHQALADAEAAGRILLAMMARRGNATPREFVLSVKAFFFSLNWHLFMCVMFESCELCREWHERVKSVGFRFTRIACATGRLRTGCYKSSLSVL